MINQLRKHMVLLGNPLIIYTQPLTRRKSP